MIRVEGYTEFAKLLVSVVIPVISDVAVSAGSLEASDSITGIDINT